MKSSDEILGSGTRVSTLAALTAVVVLVGWVAPQVADAALCGASPATTSPSYWCSNYCWSSCPQRSCTSFCCDWGFDETWQMTTCGASPFPCAKSTLCGDYVCTTNTCSSQSESPSSCPTDCVALNYSSSGEVQGAYTSLDVQQQLVNLEGRNGTLVRWTDVNEVYYDFLELDGFVNTSCHIQSIAVTYPYYPKSSFGPHDRFAISYNRYGTDQSWFVGGGCDGGPFDSSNLPRVLWAPYDNTFSNRYVAVRQELSPGLSYFLHPGGMQSAGRYVAGGIDGNDEADILILFLGSSWQNKRVVATLEQRKSQFPSGKARAEAVAIVDQANGRFLLVSGQEEGKKLILWESDGTDIETTGWSLIGELTSPSSQYSGYGSVLGGNLNFNNLALVRERGTNDIYLLGLSNEPYRCAVVGAGCGNTTAGDDSVIVPFKYHPSSHSFTLVTLPNGKNHVRLSEPCGGLDVCPSFVAGGTVFVNDEGYLEARATEHWPEGSPDLDVLEWTSR